MEVQVPKHVVAAAKMATGANSLTAAILSLLGAEEKICANDRCGAAFVFQENSPQQMHFRSDAIYCSNKCARAQAQRQYRRRQG